MGTPYDREFFETAGAGQILELGFPGRCELTRISIVRVGGGDITANVFNRKFVGDLHDISDISEVVAAGVRITVTPEAAALNDVRVGDLVTVAASSVGGYDVAHRVLAIDPSTNPRWVETDQAFTTVGIGGTVKLDIPAAEQPLSRVIAELTGTDNILVIPPGSGDKAIYVNKDPLPNANIGVRRIVYMKLDDASDYRIALTAELGVAGEG